MTKQLDINIPSSTVLRVILVLAGVYMLWFLRDLVLIVLASLVIASATEPAIVSLRKRKVPRILATLFVYTVFFSVFFVVIFMLLPPILQETSGLLKSIPGYLNTLGTGASESAKLGASFGNLSEQVNSLLQGVQEGNFLGAIGLVFGGIMSFILIVVFSFYFAINEKGIEEFLRVLSPKEYEDYVLDLWTRSQEKIGLWMQGQVLLAVLIGVLVYLGLLILDVPHALALATVAAVFELIPVFGPILSAIPAIAIAYVAGGFPLALMVLALYLIIQQFENHLIYPLVVTKVVGVPPIISILALLIGAKLAGILGILLSIPLAAVFQEIFNDWGKSKKVENKNLKSRPS